MTQILLPCIYCGNRPAAPGEHLLPSALGRFPINGLSKRVLCKREGDEAGCNESLTGPVCDRLFRRGPLSLYRRALPRGVGRSARGKKRSRGPSYESPLAPIPGSDVPAILEVDQGGASGRYADQIIFEMPDGSMKPWRIPDGITTGAQLREAAHAAGFKGTKLAHMIGDTEGRLERLIREAWPHGTIELAPPLQAGQYVTTTLARPVEAADARAIATLAFHLFLAFYSPRGGEPGFAGIRSVVLGTADPMQVVAVQDPYLAEQPIHKINDERSSQPKHLLLAYPSPTRDLIVDLRLFAHARRAPWWRVTLGNGAPPDMPHLGVALAYLKSEVRTPDGRTLDGEIVPLRSDGEVLTVPAEAGA